MTTSLEWVETMGFISWLVSIVYKILFLKGDTGFRQAHWVVKMLHLSLIVFILLENHLRSLTGMAVLSLILGLVSPGYEWAISILALSSLISLYMSLTAMIASIIGFAPVDASLIPFIAVKTLALSVILAFAFIIVSPLEVSSLLIKLGARRAGNVPLLIWRLMPYGLKSFTESLAIGYVKKEKTLNRIPPAVASLLEIGGFIEEYCFYKLNTPAKYPVLPAYSFKYSIILAVNDLIYFLLFYTPNIFIS